MRLSDNIRVYSAIFSYADDGISVHFPDLPGCLTCGQNDIEALFMAKDALRCYLAMLQDEGEPIPEPTPMYQLGETDERARITLVCIGDDQPVQHAEWIPWEHNGKASKHLMTCSGCRRYQWPKSDVLAFDRCPKCGAFMKRERKNAEATPI